jgi:2-haloacid dehalogenase/putative hydrolase of the HAD superfamily
LPSCWFMPQGDIESAVKEYDINYTASSFDELFSVINNWADK